MHGPTCIFWANLTLFALDHHAPIARGSGTDERARERPRRGLPACRSGRRRRSTGRARAIAVDVKVILTPPCIFHWQFSIQNTSICIEGSVRMTLKSTAVRLPCGRDWATGENPEVHFFRRGRDCPSSYLQQFIAVFPHECMGQLGSFGPT